MTIRWIAIVLLGCSSPGVAEPKPAPTPIDVQVDTYNVGLAGIGVPLERARRPAVLTELAKLEGDIVCLQEVWQEADKVAVRDAMRARYGHSFWARTALDPASHSSPCAGKEAELDAGVACLTNNCATPDGRVTSIDCASDHCLASVATLLAAEDKRCYACLAATLPSEKIADIGTQCRAPGPGFGFGGQASTMMLSKHPLAKTSVHVLPGCWQQRVSLLATATLPNGTTVDISCNHLSSIDDDPLIPYVCAWGDGTTGKTAWEAEQLAQAREVVGKLGGGPTIVLGDFNASPGAYGLKTLELFSALRRAPVDQCTFCADNPLTSGKENGAVDHIFVRGGTIKSAMRTFDAAPVRADGRAWPMSDHYGVRATITLDPR